MCFNWGFRTRFCDQGASQVMTNLFTFVHFIILLPPIFLCSCYKTKAFWQTKKTTRSGTVSGEDSGQQRVSSGGSRRGVSSAKKGAKVAAHFMSWCSDLGYRTKIKDTSLFAPLNLCYIKTSHRYLVLTPSLWSKH